MNSIIDSCKFLFIALIFICVFFPVHCVFQKRKKKTKTKTFEDVFDGSYLKDTNFYVCAGNHDHYGNVTGEIYYSNVCVLFIFFLVGLWLVKSVVLRFCAKLKKKKLNFCTIRKTHQSKKHIQNDEYIYSIQNDGISMIYIIAVHLIFLVVLFAVFCFFLFFFCFFFVCVCVCVCFLLYVQTKI